MAGYRRVNYYELCRLCTASEGTKMHIFREEGRRRSLPNKIQTCLPLTVHEEDALPKIICSTCVEKLESFSEFRKSCINAEALLESYYASLKYSDDLSRDGKVPVYVKEDPVEKKDDCSSAKVKQSLPTPQIIVSNASTLTSSTVNMPSTSLSSDGVTIPSAIQILTDQDGNRLAQYKVHVQGGIPSLVPNFSTVQVPLSGLQPMKTVNLSQQEGNQSTQTDNSPPPAHSLMTAISLTPQSHEVYGISQKERFRPFTQLTEALKMKNINIIDASVLEQINNQGVPGIPGMQFRIDSDQLQQLMSSGGGLQLNLNSASAIKQDRTVKEEVGSQADMELKFEDEEQQCLEDEMGDVSEGGDGEGQPFDCDLCGKGFRRKEHLLQHKKSHSGQRPFVCNSCGKAFSRKEHLLRHKVSHTGQKLYPCDICQKNFSRKDNLHKHKKTHGINGPHVCEVCGKSFVVKHYYTIHKASHVKGEKQAAVTYNCDFCEKIFSSKHSLEAHKQRHRNKLKLDEDAAQQEEQQHSQLHIQQQPHQVPQQQTIIASFPMTTINHQSLLTPNILHAGASMVQIGNGSYVCTSDILDQYRRLQSS